METVEYFEHRGISPDLGFDNIEEVAGVGEDIGFLADDLIYALLRNEALIAATCREHSIPKIPTPYRDFQRIMIRFA
jgi:predicted nucleic acid-binding protein